MQPRKSFPLSTPPLNEDELNKLIKILTVDVAAIEDEVIKSAEGAQYKALKDVNNHYERCLDGLVKRLRIIADSLFHETKISKVNPYHKDDEIPENYQNYLNTSKNLALVVTYDILSQSDFSHLIATYERWILVGMLAFHQHDFFTSSCILSGIGDASISQANINALLSYSMRSLVDYYGNLPVKPTQLYYRQKSLISLKQDIIPSLHVYSTVYIKIGDMKTEDSHEKAIIQFKRKSLSKEFSFIKKKNSSQLKLEDNTILSWLNKACNKQIPIKLIEKEKLTKLAVEQLDLKKNTTGKSSKLFSLVGYLNLNLPRLKLILLLDKFKALEEKYSDKEAIIINEIRSIICDPTYIDSDIYCKINLLYVLNKDRLSNQTVKLYKKFKSIIIDLLIHERDQGKLFNESDLKVSTNNEIQTPNNNSSNDKSNLLIRRSAKFFSDYPSPTKATEEKLHTQQTPDNEQRNSQ